MNNKKYSRPSIRSSFNEFFNVVPADSHDLLNLAHRIRYEVYCDELGYEDKDRFPDKFEIDEYDAFSQHCLVRVNSSQVHAGCIRLVSGLKNGERNLLPFETLYGDTSFKSDSIDMRDLDPASYGELSRAAVLSHFRRKQSNRADTTAINHKSTPQEEKCYPLIGFGLYLASAVMGLNSGYENVFAMMEPRLARHLRMYGINFTQIGPAIEHRGQRAPFLITRQELQEGLNDDVSNLVKDIRNSFLLKLPENTTVQKRSNSSRIINVVKTNKVGEMKMNKNKSATLSIRSTFNKYFNVVPVHSHDMLHIAHRIRYEVYCDELVYEDKERFPDKCEVDEYDSFSQHCLVKVKSSNVHAGCIRLVPGVKDGKRNLLPFERLYGNTSFKSEHINFKDLDPASYGELSRAAVISHYRRRKGDTDGLSAMNNRVVNPEEERSYPLIGFGLYLASAVMGLNSGYENVFAMMEPRLARHLRMYDINFTQVGPAIDHRGQRAPFMITKQELQEGLNDDISNLVADIRKSFQFISLSSNSQDKILTA